jgi:hypothetical protein
MAADPGNSLALVERLRTMLGDEVEDAAEGA